MKKTISLAISVALMSPLFIQASERQLAFEDSEMVSNFDNKIAVRPTMKPMSRDAEPLVSPLQMRANRLAANSVSYSFPVAADKVMDFSSKQAHSQSREFTMQVSGSELQKGVELETSAPGALVRISALDGRTAVEPHNLKLVVAGKTFGKDSAFKTLVDSHSMQKIGMGFQRGTTGFKIAEKMGKGSLKLQTEQNLAADARFQINVFDKNSDTALHLTASKNAYLKGESLQVNANLWQQGASYPLTTSKTKLIAPSGQKFSVSFDKKGSANMPLIMNAEQRPGALWTLQTEVEAMVDGQLVKRVGKIAFAYADKTATLLKTMPRVLMGDNSLTSIVPVQAKQAGRYELRAVLYGTNSKGQLVPAMVTHSASDLTAGLGMVTMQFDQKLLNQSGLQAPFELRNLQLRDQRQMALLEMK